MRVLLALALVPLVATPLGAQDAFDWPAFRGMAVAQAPEAGLGVCFGEEAAEAMACAQEMCMDRSGLGTEDCAVNLWCYPHGWAADIAMQHVEGIHWHSFVCDATDREELDALIAAKCAHEHLLECLPVAIWDWEGTELLGYDDAQ